LSDLLYDKSMSPLNLGFSTAFQTDQPMSTRR